MRDYRIRSRVGEKLPWLLYRGRAEASANDYKHFSRVMFTHRSIMHTQAAAVKTHVSDI